MHFTQCILSMRAWPLVAAIIQIIISVHRINLLDVAIWLAVIARPANFKIRAIIIVVGTRIESGRIIATIEVELQRLRTWFLVVHFHKLLLLRCWPIGVWFVGFWLMSATNWPLCTSRTVCACIALFLSKSVAQSLSCKTRPRLKVLTEEGKWSILDRRIPFLSQTCLQICQFWKVKARWKISDPAARQRNKILRSLSPQLSLVQPWTMLVFAVYCHALMSFEILRMIFKFFPTVATFAIKAILTCVTVVNYLILSIPLGALMILIRVEVWLSAVVLPVVSIDALLAIMVLFLVWTPLSFEMKRIKVVVPVKSLNQVDWDLWFVVSESAILSILASFWWIRITFAKFGLVHFRMIKLFNSVMR